MKGSGCLSRVMGVFYCIMMNDNKWLKYLLREHKDFYNALNYQRSVCYSQRIVVDINGRYETPKEKYKVAVNDGRWLVFHPRCKGGKRIHINNMKKKYRKCIRSYASFLRADGIDNANAMKYYILHYTFWHISFYRGLEITYRKTEPIIDEVVEWIMKKDIEKVDKSKFIDHRKIATPNEICRNGAIGKARKSERIKMARQSQKKLTDKEIAEKYNPDLTNEENCEIIGVCEKRLIQWKQENCESIEDKIKRLYNPELSWKKNSEIIGKSINTIKKYINKKDEKIIVDEITKSVEITDCQDIDNKDNDNLLSEIDRLMIDLYGEEYRETIEREKKIKSRLYG